MKKVVFWLIVLLMLAAPVYAAQHDYVIANNPGSLIRADINAALQAIVTNNSGASAPADTFANMWWYDTSMSLLKRRNNANDAWITLGLEAADTDGTLAANSDSKVPTQKAAKTYSDTKIAIPASSARGDLLYYNGTIYDRLPKGTSGQYLKQGANDPVWTDLSASPAGWTNMQVFTSSGTWTKPANVSKVYVKVVGAGGHGGYRGGGGGGGGYSEGLIAVSGNVTVTVGQPTSTAGETSSFVGDSTIQATGGAQGLSTQSVGTGVGGVGSGGTFNLSGGDGNASGSGGNTVFGGAGRDPSGSSDNGTAGKGNTGGGGGGAGSNASSGSNGGSGVVIVYWNQ